MKQNDEQRPDDVAINTAKALLDEDEGMQAVHSTKSVVQLLKTAKEKIATVRNSVKPEIKIDLEPKVINEVSLFSSSVIEFEFSDTPVTNSQRLYSTNQMKERD